MSIEKKDLNSSPDVLLNLMNLHKESEETFENKSDK